MNKPFVIGVCGRSCSGKSTVVNEILNRFPGKVLHIKQDKFFRKDVENQEVPGALMFERLIEVVKTLKSGRSVLIPSHKFTEVFDFNVEPCSVIVLDGFLLFVDDSLNNLIDKKIWIDVSDENMIKRRIERFGVNNRDNVGQMDYILNFVIPYSKKYEMIQREKADIVVDGNKSKREVVEEFEKIIF